MEHTLSVFLPEMSLYADFPKPREEMARECGISRGQDDPSKPLLLKVIEKMRVGDFTAHPSSKNSPGTEEFSNSPGQMRPHFQQQTVDQTPPTTGIVGSGGEQVSRKNTRNTK
jgi:hypothetical protein